MNRPLKYRAFDKAENKMLATGFNVIGETTMFGMIEAHCNEKGHGKLVDMLKYIDENIVLMEYTGLHDKNNTQIYEGDILQLDCDCEQCPHYDYVVFKNGAFTYNSYSGQPLSDACEVEVIKGNIYETPYLCEK